MKQSLIILVMIAMSSIAYADGHDSQQRKGYFNTFISAAFLIPSLQSIESSASSTKPDGETGIGFTLDFFIGEQDKHALTVDYYNLVERFGPTSIIGVGSVGSQVDTLTGFGVGYRYHFSNGIHLGAGLMSVNGEAVANDVSFTGTSVNDVQLTADLSSPDLVVPITFGYSHVYKSGFTLGARLLYVKVDALQYDQVSIGSRSFDTSSFADIADITVTSAGFLLGYAW